jgi:hypothetical protein
MANAGQSISVKFPQVGHESYEEQRSVVLLIFRNGSIEEVEPSADVVHRNGRIVCVDQQGAPISSFADSDVLYYSFSPACIRKIRQMTEHWPEPTRQPRASHREQVLAESVLERLWRMRQRKKMRNAGTR